MCQHTLNSKDLQSAKPGKQLTTAKQLSQPTLHAPKHQTMFISCPIKHQTSPNPCDEQKTEKIRPICPGAVMPCLRKSCVDLRGLQTNRQCHQRGPRTGPVDPLQNRPQATKGVQTEVLQHEPSFTHPRCLESIFSVLNRRWVQGFWYRGPRRFSIKALQVGRILGIRVFGDRQERLPRHSNAKRWRKARPAQDSSIEFETHHPSIKSKCLCESGWCWLYNLSGPLLQSLSMNKGGGPIPR